MGAIFLTFVLVELSIVFHELGHAIAMRAMDVELQSFGVGFPIPGIPCLRFRFQGIEVVLSPVLIGGFVRPTDGGQNRIGQLSYDQQALIYGAGILGNIFFSAFMVLSLVGIFSNHWGRGLLVSGVVCLVLAAFWFGRRVFCSYLMPLIGLAEAVYVMVDVLKGKGGDLSGPIGIGTLIVQESKSVEEGVLLAALLSISIAATNMLPFIPLDGGRTVNAFLKIHRPSWERPVISLGVLLLMILLGFAFYGDIANVIHLRHH